MDSPRSFLDRICVGIDLHKDTMTLARIDPGSGEISFCKLNCRSREQIVTYFESLPRPHAVAIESVGFYRWLWDLLDPIVENLFLADATQCRALAGRRLKTDREDALNVAQLLSMGRLPIAFAVSGEIARLRDWTRQRHHLSSQHARVLHRVKSLMNLDNRPGPVRMQAEGLVRYLKSLGEKLPPAHQSMLWMSVDQLTLMEREIQICDREIHKQVEGSSFSSLSRLLQTVPGVGPVVSAVVIAEVGDFSRFTYRKAIARYAGLNPRVFASGEGQREGAIAKAGSPHLRWVLQQAAWVAIRTEPAIRVIWLRIAKRSGKKAAAVAIARKLLVWIWAIVKTKTPYRAPKAA